MTTTHYILSVDLPTGGQAGIEDYEDGRSDDEHFFPDQYREGKRKGYQTWYGGCGCGSADTLEEARDILKDRLLSRAHDYHSEIDARLSYISYLHEKVVEVVNWRAEQ